MASLFPSRMSFVPLPASEAREARTTRKSHGHTQKLSTQIPPEPLSMHPFSLPCSLIRPCQVSTLFPACTPFIWLLLLLLNWNALPNSAHLSGPYSHLKTLIRYQPKSLSRILRQDSRIPNPILYLFIFPTRPYTL